MRVYEVKQNYKWFKFYFKFLFFVQAIFRIYSFINIFLEIDSLLNEVEHLDIYDAIQIYIAFIIEIISVLLFIILFIRLLKKDEKTVITLLVLLWFHLISNSILYLWTSELNEVVGQLIGTWVWFIPNIYYFNKRKDGFNECINENKNLDKSITDNEEHKDDNDEVKLDKKSEIIDKANISPDEKIKLVKNKEKLTVKQIEEKIEKLEDNASNFCPNCGKSIEPKWKFCKHCGEKI